MKTISYELSKAIHNKAEEKGVKLPESEETIYHVKKGVYKDGIVHVVSKTEYPPQGWDMHKKEIATWNTDELLEILPPTLEKDGKRFMLQMLRCTMYDHSQSDIIDCFLFYYSSPKHKDMFNSESLRDKEPYEALGQLYLYLIDKGLIK